MKFNVNGLQNALRSQTNTSTCTAHYKLSFQMEKWNFLKRRISLAVRENKLPFTYSTGAQRFLIQAYFASHPEKSVIWTEKETQWLHRNRQLSLKMTIQLLSPKQIMLEMDILITPKSKSYLLCYAVRCEV